MSESALEDSNVIKSTFDIPLTDSNVTLNNDTIHDLSLMELNQGHVKEDVLDIQNVNKENEIEEILALEVKRKNSVESRIPVLSPQFLVKAEAGIKAEIEAERVFARLASAPVAASSTLKSKKLISDFVTPAKNVSTKVEAKSTAKPIPRPASAKPTFSRNDKLLVPVSIAAPVSKPVEKLIPKQEIKPRPSTAHVSSKAATIQHKDISTPKKPTVAIAPRLSVNKAKVVGKTSEELELDRVRLEKDALDKERKDKQNLVNKVKTSKPSVMEHHTTVPLAPKLHASRPKSDVLTSDEIEMERARKEVESLDKQRAEKMAIIEKIKQKQGIVTKPLPTVPVEFSFQTSKRVPLNDSDSQLSARSNDSKDAGKSSRQSGPTIPQPFKFSESKSSKVLPVSDFVPMSVQVDQTLKSFRSSDVDLSSKPIGPTIPVGFVSKLDERLKNKPKELSTEERIELEMSQHKFHARPLNPAILNSKVIVEHKENKVTVPISPKSYLKQRKGSPKKDEVEKVKQEEDIRKIVTPREVLPFQLSTDIRGSTKEARLADKLKQLEVEEQKAREFFAKPLNSHSFVSKFENKVHLNKAARLSMETKSSLKREVNDTVTTFHALPIPETHLKPFVPKKEETKIEIVPFSCVSNDRAKKRLEFEENLKMKRIEFEEARKRAEIEEKKKEEEDILALRESMKFKARPIPKSLHKELIKEDQESG